MSSIRVVLGLVASLDLEIKQMDVKTAFLHGDLDKEIYMEQPKDFTIKEKEDYVCKLKKSLYGLKQAPRQWYKKFESVMGKNVSRIDKLKKQLSKSFSMKDLGPTKKILGIRIEKDRASKKLHFKLSSRHNPSIYKEKKDMRRVTYASIVGSLMYVMVCTRPDIAYAIGVVSHFVSNPGRLHWEAVK
ncbi:Retrovirus-related Pol polyprotein from transposon TNT 1-94 [Vitis vinifera]|uniref:Retrovirus-related Pol polyprotein from transposon TNT 1-94 n=1 Tax=Vitis vinifera TaxID=29760 RepID=A0A438CGY9_VITVI|nr:Retrovirus-related Pol polyprotein from transposon TNT 1-94 [Vitis vinifera]